MTLLLLRRFATLAIALGCTACPRVGVVDAGPDPIDAGPGPRVITAQDIGTVCTYDFSNPRNPTNTCPQGLGLTCLIVTADGAFTPFAGGNARNLLKPVWEDQFSVYRDDGVDEGFCTLVGQTPQVPPCPIGTTPKFLEPDLSVCLRDCQSPADCNRIGYTCDSRYFDVAGGSCHRQCQLDLPDCIRSAHVTRPDGTITMHLLEEDLRGSSFCDVETGLCAANPGDGVNQVGEPCTNSQDCTGGLICLQGLIFRSLDGTLPEDTQGVCTRPCKPGDPNDPNARLGLGCLGGEACQAGFTFNHGNPFDPNLENADGFLAIVPPDNFVEAGGWCFPECQSNAGDCSQTFNSACGTAAPIFGQPWNQVSMCLADALRE